VPTLESNIDDLYRVAPDEFTAARNALAKTLSGADASRVRKLAKPTVVPWAVNQLYWRSRPTYDRLLTSGARLRKAQIDALEGRRADVRAAGEAHRAAIADAVKQASRIAAAAGVHPAPDALTRTIEALSLMREAPDPPGRLTEALQPAGFEALAGVPVRDAAPTPRATVSKAGAFDPNRDSHASHQPRAPHEPAKPTREEARRVAETQKREREEARQREAAARAHAAAVQKAEATLARAQSAAALAREAAERADKAVADAEADLRQLHARTHR
jgi:hypothetical protein